MHPLTDADARAAGDILPLTSTPMRHWAILHERWENFTLTDQNYWKDILVNGPVRFAGSVLSHQRQQIEIVLIFSERRPCGAYMACFCITLADFEAFRLEN